MANEPESVETQIPLEIAQDIATSALPGKGTRQIAKTALGVGSAVSSATGLSVAATSGAGITSGLAAAGGVVGGGMAAGPAVFAAAPTYYGAKALNKLAFKDKALDSDEEKSAKKAARIATQIGVPVGLASTSAVVTAGGASGAAIMGTLATMGSFVGGGAIAGVGVATVIPLIIVGTCGLTAYRVFGGGKKRSPETLVQSTINLRSENAELPRKNEMGDFEDVFGAGADADDIIDAYSREYSHSSRVGKANWFGSASPSQIEDAERLDEIESWRKSMVRKGHKKGPNFSTYANLSEWLRTNTRPHIRRPSPIGFEVYFTD